MASVSFHESPDKNYRARKAVVVFTQDRGFNGFAHSMIKLPRYPGTAEWTGLLARTRTLILRFLFEYLILAPKSYQKFRETGRLLQAVHVAEFSPEVSVSLVRGSDQFRIVRKAINAQQGNNIMLKHCLH